MNSSLMNSFTSTMVVVVLLALLAACVHCSNQCDEACKQQRKDNATQHIKEINAHPKNGGKWKAELNEHNEKFALMDKEGKKRFAGTLLRKANSKTNASPSDNGLAKSAGNKVPPPNADMGGAASSRARRATTLTASFDSRKQWPTCAAFINDITDQADCGSCWAVSTAGAIQDRICIAYVNYDHLITGSAPSNPNNPYYYVSAIDIGTCSGGAPNNGDACQGGYVADAWQYVVQKGAVSGSNNTQNAGCKPYPFPSTGGPYTATQCTAGCTNTAYTTYKWFLANSTQLGDGTSTYEQQMMQEIYKNGPLVATFTVYEDFYYYTGGVYVQTSNTEIGGHAVRVIGWGTQLVNGVSTPYWLVANSWGTGWGMGGFFMIRRGTNECGFEQWINYGVEA